MSKTRSNREGNIRHRADGRYEVRVTTGIDFATGEAKRVSCYAKTKQEAVKLLNTMTFINNTSPKSFEAVTLGDWLELCLETYMKPSLKQSTYLSYESYIRVHFKPALGDVLLKDVNPRLLQTFYNYKLYEQGLSPKTVVNMNLFLHKALDFALGEGYIQGNPTEAINLPHGQNPPIKILTRDEQARLMQGSYMHRYGVFIRLTLFTGIRIGELLGLQWTDVDLQGSKININQTLNRLNKIGAVTPGESTTEIVVQSPKSQNSRRSIPIIPAVKRDLIAWQSVQQRDKEMAGGMYQESGYVVTNEFGGYVEPRTFKDYYNQILKISGLPHFTFHALRHTFASRALEQGMDSNTLSVIMGHYSVSFTLDTYAHVLDDHKEENMALMSELYNAQPTTPADITYPVIVTNLEDGEVEIAVCSCPDITYNGDNLAAGLQYIKDCLSEKVLTDPYPPIPPAAPLLPNQMLLYISP